MSFEETSLSMKYSSTCQNYGLGIARALCEDCAVIAAHIAIKHAMSCLHWVLFRDGHSCDLHGMEACRLTRAEAGRIHGGGSEFRAGRVESISALNIGPASTPQNVPTKRALLSHYLQ